MSTQVQTNVGPCVEVVSSVNRSADAVGGTDGPVLLKGRGALNGGCINSSTLIDVVRSPVRLKSPLIAGTRGGIVCSEGFNNIVLDKRVGAPAIDSKVAVAIGVVATAVVDGPAMQPGLSDLLGSKC